MITHAKCFSFTVILLNFLLVSSWGAVCQLEPGDRLRLADNYSPFGEEISNRGGAAAHCPFRFQSRYLDPSGHYYIGKRYYHPGIGRWLSPDPKREIAGLHTYAYCGNDPGNAHDPIGLNAVNVSSTNVTWQGEEDGALWNTDAGEPLHIGKRLGNLVQLDAQFSGTIVRVDDLRTARGERLDAGDHWVSKNPKTTPTAFKNVVANSVWSIVTLGSGNCPWETYVDRTMHETAYRFYYVGGIIATEILLAVATSGTRMAACHRRSWGFPRKGSRRKTPISCCMV